MPEKEIKLFPHNEVAYDKLVKSLSSYPLAFIEHATGTGKSFILLKYLYTECRQKRILFISMHEEMFSQLFEEQMSTLGISKDEFNCFDTMIYPNILKHNMKDIIKNYDCIVFDEAHHCGAEKWSKKVEKLKKLVLETPGKTMIGATATSIRYLDDYTDVSEIYFNGRTVSKLPISTSILKNLLPAPIYINSLASCLEKYERVKNKLNKLPFNEETMNKRESLSKIGDKLRSESSIPHILKKYGAKPGEKYIVFCSSIKDLKQKQQEAQEWFKDIGTIKTFAAHSGQKKEKNKKEIADFSKKRDEISLMFAVDIFNEGFHIEGVDGVLMFRKTKSPIIYFQQIGRALSFSVRKKQIKIFDFVDNISDMDVIYNLYKEMISESRRLAASDPDNKEYYYEILKRFEIIDETTQIIDTLNDIEKDLDENYIKKNNILHAISKLEEYRFFYPKTDFRKELNENRVAKDYLNAFIFICRMSDNLTIEEIERIQKLNIHFSKEINLPISKRKELLGEYKTIRELKESEYQLFLRTYIDFYNKNGRRPVSGKNTLETELNDTYRYYLNELSPSKIKKLTHSLPFPATVEEIILSGNYPEKNLINLYVLKIKEKIGNNIPLDNVEIKVMKKIIHTLSLKDYKLIDYINSYSDINYKIENAINIIASYKEAYPEETFANIDSLIGENNIYQAIKTIHKYATRITNSQFEKLLSLNIVLPKRINMTLAQRLNLLGEYQSFYEKEQNDSTTTFNEYLKFIKENNRRPDRTKPEESNLYERYQNCISKTTTSKIRSICEILKLYNIELSFFEKIISGEKININIINIFIKNIVKKLHSNIEISEEEIRLLRSINRQGYSISVINLEDLIIEITSIKELNMLINKLVELKTSNNQYEILVITKQISSKSKHLTRNHLEHLLSLGIEIPKELVDTINSLSGYLNIFDKEIKQKQSFVEKFTKYLDEFSKRPPKNSELDQMYREYIPSLSKHQIIYFTNIFTVRNIALSFEEKVLIDLPIDTEEKRKYLEEITKKSSSHIPLDTLENRVTNRLRAKGMVGERAKNIINNSRIKSKETTLEEHIVARLKEAIARNPKEPINFEGTLYNISATNRRSLENFRLRLLAPSFLKDILKKMKTERKPLIECLTIKEYTEFNEYLKLDNLDEESLILISNIKSLDVDFKFLQKGVERQKLVNRYITFIEDNAGRKPSISSPAEKEKTLAKEFTELQELLTPTDLKKIAQAQKSSVEEINSETFYNAFYNFIINNGRFPCGNSDNPEEVNLNNLYVTISPKLTKEQLLELKKLKKIYSKATVKANLEFSKKQQLGYNKK